MSETLAAPADAAAALAGITIAPPEGPPPGPATLPFRRQKMVRWLAPGQLAVTAVRALLSGTFGAYADRREVQAALHQNDGEGAEPGTASGRIYRYDAQAGPDGEFWLDFVADLGDGFDPTFTVAWLLGRPGLPVPPPGQDAPVSVDGATGGASTRRGRLLVMGGDQVYPTASRDEYSNRLAGPYEAALPWVTRDPPHLFAIPGNHDWYDGLTSFIRQFCQPRWIGAWHTQQSRSYWALQLPHRWWVFGVDVQLQSDIDRPQLAYFRAVAAEMRPGDRVILCTPEPAWVHTRCEPGSFDNLAFFEREVITPSGAELALTLTGDLHHYARYFSGDGDTARHKITAGGGGAYLLGTQLLPTTLELELTGKDAPATPDPTTDVPTETWTRGPLYPGLRASLGMKSGALLLWLKNPSFALLLGLVYVFFGWLLESSSRTGGKSNSFKFLLQTSSFSQAGGVLQRFWDVLQFSPLLLSVTLLLVGAMIGFAAPDVERSKLLLEHPRLRSVARVLVGGIHGLAHVALAIVVTWVWYRVEIDTDPVLANVLLFLGKILFGGLAGSLLFALFLLPLVNYNEAYSSQHLETYKNFVRLKIGGDGKLTLWGYGVRSPGRWKFRPSAPGGQPYFDAVTEPKVRVIDGPLTLAAPSSDGTPDPIGAAA